MTVRHIKVEGYATQFDALWALLFHGQCQWGPWAASLVDGALPVVHFAEKAIRLCWPDGRLCVRYEGSSVRADELSHEDDRIAQLVRTGVVDLFQTNFGMFTLNFGNDDARPRITRADDSVNLDWPNSRPWVDVPWWPFDPEIRSVQAFENRVVTINTTRGLSVKLEFTQ